ncbi:hypothetical protein [Falsiroseomonas selenitidurans]|uniref:Nucleotide-diphospho-sugar transferase domain-containing protein n=1 Tax=Falsiroseomonas selenitidurans TaxID=2716335 RepID=A0ABX1E2X4_9PROT|nr:hypothetical protein [Falsiroseomonas selenitidurans]NKC30117.1 hypothetical protein [Falsiroseomonas selenitidurans]
MPEVILFQTADAEHYYPMLMATLPANRRFCLAQGLRMEVFIGIRRGRHAWQASYNRLGFLADRLAEDYRGWVIHLDADAFIAEPGFDLPAYLQRHAETAMIHPPGARTAAWDINSGVFLWNFARPEAREAARRWVAAFAAIPDAALEAATQWNMVRNDQTMLHHILRDDAALLAGLHVEDDRLLGYQHSRFIKQFVSNETHTLDQRIARIAAAVALVPGQPRAAAPAPEVASLQAAGALLRAAPPELLARAVPRHEAAALAVAMAEVLRG